MTPTTRFTSSPLLAAAIVLASAGAGCTTGGDVCGGDEDCDRGERCDESTNTCMLAADMGGGSVDMGGGSVDMGGGMLVTGPCLVDPFEASCQNDDPRPNESWSSAVGLVEEVFGCRGAQDESFVPANLLLERGSLCASERADWYRVEAVSCRSLRFVVEVELRPTGDACPAGVPTLWVEPWVDEASDCDPGNERAVCEDLPGGGRRVRLFVEPGDSQRSYYIGVEPGGPRPDQVQFPYELQVQVRIP